ncbi:XRE family transcriptional regulator [Xanthobacteraceae bacterium Astr-EGSB]|uniref:S24 family peptidase n=1 Tax=Astrobacterium formosum TaxID=3069710 RepID=UPI0027B18BD4|nr:XRE family transcriptional regulator [Xanthobacteraceae bacterium Astr-EGSB]
MTLSPIHQWVAKALEVSGLSQAEMARRLTTELRRDIDRAAVNKMVKGTRDVAADEMLAIETISGVPAPSINAITKVPLIEWVSAGKLSEPASQLAADQAPQLAFADLGRGDFFALKVEGNSMDRISPEGSIILVNRAERTLVNGRFYVFSLRGKTTYKRWRADDPPYLAPYSTDPVHGPIFVKKKDFEVVGRVRRTLMDL